MDAATALLETAAQAGCDVCFANPGTTEMALVNALERVPAVRPVLGLFEGVCTGAADGYARMRDHPALTLLHLGPGFANGIANLHNARRAFSPVVNLIGDHASWHLAADAPLHSDIASLAPHSPDAVPAGTGHAIWSHTATVSSTTVDPNASTVTVAVVPGPHRPLLIPLLAMPSVSIALPSRCPIA